MTVNAGRGRRRATAAAEVEPEATLKPASRRRGSAAAPAPLAEVAPPPLELVPPPPAEEPAVLHPSDRRGPTRPFSTPAERMTYATSVDQMAIGEIDQTLFDCPTCRRPLALGARRCPGCGARLVRGILVRKASLFVAGGVALGAIIGIAGSLVLGRGLAGGVIPVAVTSSSAPGASTGASAPASGGTIASAAPTASSQPTTPPDGGSIPSVVRSALGQVIATNDRLAVAEAELRVALASRTFDASAVAATLRSISADSVFGEQLAGPIVAWSGGGDLGSQLATFYGTVHDTAAEALTNSVRNPAAYKSAAKTMIAVLAGRTAIDEAVRSAAASAGVILPAASTAP